MLWLTDVCLHASVVRLRFDIAGVSWWSSTDMRNTTVTFVTFSSMTRYDHTRSTRVCHCYTCTWKRHVNCVAYVSNVYNILTSRSPLALPSPQFKKCMLCCYWSEGDGHLPVRRADHQSLPQTARRRRELLQARQARHGGGNRASCSPHDLRPRAVHLMTYGEELSTS